MAKFVAAALPDPSRPLQTPPDSSRLLQTPLPDSCLLLLGFAGLPNPELSESLHCPNHCPTFEAYILWGKRAPGVECRLVPLPFRVCSLLSADSFQTLPALL